MKKFFILGVMATAITKLCVAQSSENIDATHPEQEKSFAEQGLLIQGKDAAQPISSDLIKNVKLSNLRLGFVNFRRIMSTIPQLSAIRRSLDSEFSTQQQELLQAQKALETLEQKVARHANESDYDVLTQQLIEKRREITRQDAAFRDNYSVRRNEEIAKLQSLVLDQIVSLAKEQSFDVILNDTGVLYVSEKADLTELVIERLNKLAHQEGAISISQNRTKVSGNNQSQTTSESIENRKMEGAHE